LSKNNYLAGDYQNQREIQLSKLCHETKNKLVKARIRKNAYEIKKYCEGILKSKEFEVRVLDREEETYKQNKADIRRARQGYFIHMIVFFRILYATKQVPQIERMHRLTEAVRIRKELRLKRIVETIRTILKSTYELQEYRNIKISFESTHILAFSIRDTVRRQSSIITGSFFSKICEVLSRRNKLFKVHRISRVLV